jgi:hypothetical protein
VESLPKSSGLRVPPVRLGREENTGLDPMYLGGIAVADFNGDGLIDVVMAGYFKPAHDEKQNCLESTEARVYINVSKKGGPIRFQRGATFGDLGVCSAQVVTGDFNGDRKMDFAVQIKNGVDTTAYLGKGDGTFRAVVLEKKFSDHSSSHGMAAADIDHDGADDLVFNADGDADYYKAGKALWYKWKGSGFAPMQEDFSHAIAYGGTIAAGDLDGDGFPEIAIAGNATRPFGEHSCANKLYGEIHHNAHGVIEKKSMAVVANFALRASGRASADVPPNPDRLKETCAGGDNVQYAIADVDRDGHNDLIVAGSGGFGGRPDMPGAAHYSFAILRNVDGTGRAFVTWENVGIGPDGRPGHLSGNSTNTGVGNVDLQSIAVGDLNGDGWPEIFIQGHRRSLESDPGRYVFDTMLFLNQKDGDWLWVPGALDLPKPLGSCGDVIADLDQDGANDLIICGAEIPFHSNGNNPEDKNTRETIKTYVFRGL